MWIKKVLMLVLADILIVLISYFMALLLRFDFVFSSIPEEYLMGYLWSMPFWIISTIVIFYICRLYHSIWRLASVAELQMILIASAYWQWFIHWACCSCRCICQDPTILSDFC